MQASKMTRKEIKEEKFFHQKRKHFKVGKIGVNPRI